MKTRAAGFFALIAGVGMILASGNVTAETKAPAADVFAAVKPKAANAPIRLTDSQLDKVVAGISTHIAGNTPAGHTIVYTSTGGSGGQFVTTCTYYTGSGKPSNKPC